MSLHPDILLSLSALPDCGARDLVMKQIAALEAENERLRGALEAIATNKLTGPAGIGPLYHAGVSAGLAIAADMANRALSLKQGERRGAEHE